MDEREIDILISQNWHRMQDLVKMKTYRNNRSMLQKEIDFRKDIDEKINDSNITPEEERKIVQKLLNFNRDLESKGVTLNSQV